MSDNQGIYDIANKLLQKRVYEYDGTLSGREGIKLKFKYRFKIVGDLPLKHMGEPMNHVGIELIILEMEYPIFVDLFKGFDGEDLRINRYNFEDRMYYLSGKLKQQIWDELKYFSISDTPEIVKVKIDIPNSDGDEVKQITESKGMKRNVVRQVVRDIITIFKNEGEGEYVLPEDITDDVSYFFENLNTEFNVELKIDESDEVNGFDLDGGYYEDEDTMEISILYNPKDFPNRLYDLVGELNEVVRHELEHLLQAERGEDLTPDERSPEIYYTRPHELGAEVAGFKRSSKLKNQPFEKSVRDWFIKNKHIHKMDDLATERVIQKILQRYRGE